jgi:dipeptidyl-peptidase-4
MKKQLIIFLSILIALPGLAQRELTNELIWASRTFASKDINDVQSMNDGEHFTFLQDSENGPTVVKHKYKDFSFAGTIVASSEVKVDGEPIKIEDYYFNADETQMLIATEIEYIYRRSYKAFFFVFDLKTKTTRPLADPKLGKQMLAEFSPDGKKVAFTRNNDIYFLELASNKETRVTNDGKQNEIINGSTDWVYEEEFSIVKGFYWSPGSTQLAYYRFDESQVKEFTMAMYGDLYPFQYKFKYPKAGEDNSKISVFVYGLNDGKSKPVDLGKDSDIYIPRMQWTNYDDRLCVLRMNRLQNKLEYCLVDTKQSTLGLKPIYTETSETYVEVTDDLIFLGNRDAFVRTSERDGYNHIYLIDFNGLATQVTKGNWDVVEFNGLDETKGLIYYTSAESAAWQKDVYSIKLDGTKKTKLSTRPGTNYALFSSSFKYFVNYHNDANHPNYITLHKSDGKQIKVLEDNADLNTRMSTYNLSKKEFIKVPTPNDTLNGWMIKPVNFDPNKKYPVYLFVYGGPGNNEVTDTWDGAGYFWHMLLAQKGYIVMCVDPRGTMFRGEKFKKCTYLQLGKLETEDCIETAKWLQKQSYVDGSRIGIQGWSFGGYMTLLCMTKGADYFKMGISIAPVTNWRFYDNIYTERFMRKPQENASGYDNNSPINHVKLLKGKLLLVHGSGDDNVHYQNTMEMINAFVSANKQFDLFIYPNRNHGIYGGYTRLHLYTKMTNYVLDNL